MLKIDNKYKNNLEKEIYECYNNNFRKQLLRILEECDRELLLYCAKNDYGCAYVALEYYKPNEDWLIKDSPIEIDNFLLEDWHIDWIKAVYTKEGANPEEELENVLRIRLKRIIAREINFFECDIKIII